MNSRRILDHPILGPLPEAREVTIHVDGRPVKAREGEPIAAALVAAAEEAGVVPHEEVGLDALVQVQAHADDDEQARPPQERRNAEGNFQPGCYRLRNHRHHGQERRAAVRDPFHNAL